MSTRVGFRLVMLLSGLLVLPATSAHPENSPLTFIAHKTADGRVIYTNIPKRCFSDGVLTCARYHPIYNGTATAGESNKSTN